MHKVKKNLLSVNGGSSSIKFAMHESGAALILLLEGSIESINSGQCTFNCTNHVTGKVENHSIRPAGFDEATNYLIDWFAVQEGSTKIDAIGHRFVHGMEHTAAEKITPFLLQELKKIAAYDPEHLPAEIKLIEAFTAQFPSAIQVACFDTAFHTTMPMVAKLLAIPRKYYEMGIHRYGFHGLSYEYLLAELNRIEDNAAAKERVIIAHLGNGASLAAIKNGKSIDTTMGFTPASGLMMSTRSGDIDPGVPWYLMKIKKMSTQQYSDLVNHESGLLGISETTSDMNELIMRKNDDSRAAEAFGLFCYQIKKYIGGYWAILEGLDTIIFSGGIGENSPEVRNQVCRGLEFSGIELDEIKNRNNEAIISKPSGKVTVRVIHTNEQLMIAKLVAEVIKQPVNK